jgi:hypothetical protein
MSWAAEQNAILAYWAANTTVASANRALDAFNGPAFVEPMIDPTAPASAIWCRLSVVTLPSTTRPFGIGSAAHRYHDGLIYRQIFIPRGFGEAIADSIIESEVELFHRVSLASGLVRCRDCYTPERIPPDEDDAPFVQINVVNPYYVIDPATAES